MGIIPRHGQERHAHAQEEEEGEVMTFMEAAKAMQDGKRVRRKVWEGWMFADGPVVWYISNKAPRQMNIFISDITAIDWQIVEDE